MGSKPNITQVTTSAICADLAQKLPHKQIAKTYDVHPNTVQNIKNNHRQLIEQASADIISNCLQSIVNQTTIETQNALILTKDLLFILKQPTTTILNQDSELIELFPKDRVNAINSFLARIDKKQELMLKAVGLYPSHAPSMIVNQTILNDNRATVSNVIMSFLSQCDDTAEAEDED